MATGGGRLKQIFQDVDLRQGIDGLRALAKKHKLDLTKLEEGEYVAFFNTTRTYLKLAAANNVLACRRMEGGRFYDLSCIVGVVRAFHNRGELAYDKELKKHLEELLRRKAHARPVDEE